MKNHKFLVKCQQINEAGGSMNNYNKSNGGGDKQYTEHSEG